MNAGDDLSEAIALLHQAQEASEPSSPRAHVVGALVRIVGVAMEIKRQAEDERAGVVGQAQMHALRDIARDEQDWVRSYLGQTAVGQAEGDALTYYRTVLARIEGLYLMSMAYMGTERERGKEASWLAKTLGSTLIVMLAEMARYVGVLPEPRRPADPAAPIRH